MTKIILSLFLVFSLLAGPVLASSQDYCLGQNCHSAEFSTSKKPEQTPDFLHHGCCHAHSADRSVQYLDLEAADWQASIAIPAKDQTWVGKNPNPLLEPPLHA